MSIEDVKKEVQYLTSLQSKSLFLDAKYHYRSNKIKRLSKFIEGWVACEKAKEAELKGALIIPDGVKIKDLDYSYEDHTELSPPTREEWWDVYIKYEGVMYEGYSDISQHEALRNALEQINESK